MFGYLIAAAAGAAVYHWWMRHHEADCQLDMPPLLDGVRMITMTSAPVAPSGMAPQAGLASGLSVEWIYTVQPGDTAGSITERVVGTSGRYTDLMLANPDVPREGRASEVLGNDAWEFAPGALTVGMKLRIPATWNPWIDQLGYARGTLLPWPPDERKSETAPSTSVQGYASHADAAAHVPRGLLGMGG